MIVRMSVRVRLVVASALMLFTELLLIRWLGANLLHLSYFSNIVLLGSFLGIGLGFLMAKPGRQSPWWFPLGLALLVIAVILVARRDRPDRQRHHLLHGRCRPPRAFRRRSPSRWSSRRSPLC